MGIIDSYEVNITIQTTIEGKISHLGIDSIILRVVDCNGNQVFAILSIDIIPGMWQIHKI